MATKERILRVVRQEAAAPRGLQRRAVSRRALYRVDTTGMDLDAEVRVGAATLRGPLLNLSAAGCCVRIPAPLLAALPDALDAGDAASVTLRTDAHTLVCGAEVIALDAGAAADAADAAGAEIRLRFGALTPQTQRALLAWINALVTRSFQSRYTTSH